MSEELYTIGKVGEICQITTKALRYYDKMGILSPDKVANESGYRYYSKKNLLAVPMIKYYKQSGFKLEEMRGFLKGTTYDFFDKRFRKKIDELNELEKEINLKKRSIKDWHNLIVEAQMVIENNVCDVAVKYINSHNLTFLNQSFEYDYMDSIINIEFNNYIDSINNAVTGPVIICFPSFEDKINGKCNKIKIMQETILKCKEEVIIEFGGWMAVACYHIGTHETINETYKKIQEWTKGHGYICSEESYERYVTDYWTTKNMDKFVTEILVKVKREN
ncbi:MerR family transcriptional regulator [Clostridium frigidicarnis]|uniref:DNA-binding transcriptional regulator, MerR family n=1 Tax=Clostridium frigidicarnis TaxID=84698 RepID=A0A1I0XGU6_9CLOT|nr:MerR family transcriptional regulator [Clostridium frigidicarnis]SFA99530.1 DNA-binding transcriptional regulator, MerR family [Clostridium frigidicarnis]